MEEELNKIGMKVDIRETKTVRVGKEEMVLVKVKGEEQKKVIIKKGNLKRRREGILEYWTWKEKKMRWRLKK